MFRGKAWEFGGEASPLPPSHWMKPCQGKAFALDLQYVLVQDKLKPVNDLLAKGQW